MPAGAAPPPACLHRNTKIVPRTQGSRIQIPLPYTSGLYFIPGWGLRTVTDITQLSSQPTARRGFRHSAREHFRLKESSQVGMVRRIDFYYIH
jgi:hypothetical protein